MGERGDEHDDAEVAAVVEQRQEASVQPAQRADHQDDVQQEERGGAEADPAIRRFRSPVPAV